MSGSDRFVFPNARGQELAGRLDRPAGKPLAWALFAHCFTCSKDNLAASRIARALTGQGIGVLRFDFTGLGGSEGDFGNTGFSSNVADLLAAADELRRQAQAPRVLIGHSLGGAAVLAAAPEVSECALVATINAPSDVRHVTRLFRSSIPEIEAEGEARVELAGRCFRISRKFIEDIRDENLLDDKIARLEKALLIFHSPQDSSVSIEHAGRIYAAARHPKSFIALDGADHLLTRGEDAEYVAGVVALWCRRYL